MKVRDVMTHDVQLTSPGDTMERAAQMMATIDSGVLPVGEQDRLIGVVTDRDLVVRGLADGKDPKSTPVRDVMSDQVRYCFEDEDLDHVAENMAELQVRRLPVVDRGKRLVGIVSLGDIATQHEPSKAGEALSGISRPGH